jgi:beta-lactam-binding protein with PASTA domain
VPGCTSVRGCAEALAEAGFTSQTVRVDSARREGALLGTSPPRGGRAVPGQLISILVSNGEDYVEPKPERPRQSAPGPERETPAPATSEAPPPPPAEQTEQQPPQQGGPPADEDQDVAEGRERGGGDRGGED